MPSAVTALCCHLVFGVGAFSQHLACGVLSLLLASTFWQVCALSSARACRGENIYFRAS